VGKGKTKGVRVIGSFPRMGGTRDEMFDLGGTEFSRRVGAFNHNSSPVFYCWVIFARGVLRPHSSFDRFFARFRALVGCSIPHHVPRLCVEG